MIVARLHHLGNRLPRGQQAVVPGSLFASFAESPPGTRYEVSSRRRGVRGIWPWQSIPNHCPKTSDYGLLWAEEKKKLYSRVPHVIRKGGRDDNDVRRWRLVTGTPPPPTRLLPPTSMRVQCSQRGPMRMRGCLVSISAVDQEKIERAGHRTNQAPYPSLSALL